MENEMNSHGKLREGGEEEGGMNQNKDKKSGRKDWKEEVQ